MKLKIFYLHIVVLLGLTFQNFNSNHEELYPISNLKLLTHKTTFKAGETITLQFSSSTNTPLLYCSNSYGSTLIKPIKKEGILNYNIPQNMSKKIGVVHWEVLDESSPLNGTIQVIAREQAALLETYIGPPSIEAGGIDYTMLVVIPTDNLDNPLPDNTLVTTKHQFLTRIETDTVKTQHLIAYKNIYSEDKSGRMLVSSESQNTNSKEFTINVFPSVPEGFKISAERPHDYADGNQQTIFTTSIIKDKHGNLVSDGTFVTFFITTSKGYILKTYGTTVKGIAEARMVHPDHQSQWKVQGYVSGITESNTIELNYKQVFKDFEVKFSENNRIVTVGPLQSFMKQMAPDGLEVKLLIYKNDILIEKYSKASVDGFVNFDLKSNTLQNDTYDFVIKTAGIKTSFKAKTLW